MKISVRSTQFDPVDVVLLPLTLDSALLVFSGRSYALVVYSSIRYGPSN